MPAPTEDTADLRIYSESRGLIVDYQHKSDRAARKLYRDRYNRPKGFYFVTDDAEFYGPFDTAEEAKEGHDDHMKAIHGICA